MQTVYLPCPICNRTLQVEVTIEVDSDGDADSPYGLRHFLTMDEYAIVGDEDSNSDHQLCIDAMDAFAELASIYQTLSDNNSTLGRAAGPRNRPHPHAKLKNQFEQELFDRASRDYRDGSSD